MWSCECQGSYVSKNKNSKRLSQESKGKALFSLFHFVWIIQSRLLTVQPELVDIFHTAGTERKFEVALVCVTVQEVIMESWHTGFRFTDLKVNQNSCKF